MWWPAHLGGPGAREPRKRHKSPQIEIPASIWHRFKMSSLDELYQEVLLDHFKHPRRFGPLPDADARFSVFNPLCGDQVEVAIKVKDGKIDNILFSGHGCSISQASASMMTELCAGKTIEEVREILGLYRKMMRGETQEQELARLGDVVTLQGIRKFTARMKCALIAWDALERCLGTVPEK